MKKIFLLSFLVFSMFGCSVTDDVPSFYTEILPIESVDIPEEFEFGQVYDITVSYFRPSGCHVFSNFYYEINENERIVAVINTVYENLDCEIFEPQANEVEATFNFQVNSIDTYTFKFYQGQDENGSDLYYIVEVPVVIN